jgi:hypothetical protein
LFDQLDAPLAAGMAPIDTATKGGLAAPTPIAPDETGAPRKLLQFGFNIRHQTVTRYAPQYRYGRVREISDAQRRNIRARYYDRRDARRCARQRKSRAKCAKWWA